MKDLLLSVLTQCIESDGPVQINEAEYPEQMYSLIRQQQQIGWAQILVGRFSTQSILESGQFTKAQVRRLNFCRLYLQAVTLSDITDANGTELDHSKRRGDCSSQSSKTTLLRVNQARPSSVEWTLWRKANLIWSYRDSKLHNPLGEWLINPMQQRQRHFAYIRKHRMSQRLYIQVGHTYTLCRPTPQPHVLQFSKVTIPFESLPLDSQPVEVSPTDNSDWWQVNTVQRPPIPLPHRMPITATFADFVDTLAPWEIDLLRHTTMHVDPYTLCNAMTPGVKGGSDGSVRYHTEGSFGWVISSEHGERVAQGMGPVRSPRPTSYRAEASGLLSLLRFLLRVSEFTSMVDPWKGTIVTDSYSVLKTLGGGDVDPQDALDKPIKIDGDKVVLDVLCPKWDLLIEIQHALIHLPEMTLRFI
jgi:hypothetical protein